MLSLPSLTCCANLTASNRLAISIGVLKSSFMNDDFNTPILIANLFDAVKFAQHVNDGRESITKEDLNALQTTLHNFVYDVLGLTKEEQEGDHYLEDALQLLIELRNDARKRKDFAASDKIRDELSKAGIVLQDGPQETTFTLK